MEIYVRLSDSASCVSINLLEVNKKYVILHAKRFHTASHPIILFTIQYSEHKTDIFLPERFSGIFTDRLIDIINTSAIHTTLVFKGLDGSSHFFVLGFE
jgi:hypothetical protein